MQTYSTGNFQRISIKELPSGTLIYKNMTTKSYMSPGKPIHPPMPFPDLQGLTKEKQITRISSCSLKKNL
jgi:hypothetical protein